MLLDFVIDRLKQEIEFGIQSNREFSLATRDGVGAGSASADAGVAAAGISINVGMFCAG